jgi:hypothetical protein
MMPEETAVEVVDLVASGPSIEPSAHEFSLMEWPEPR